MTNSSKLACATLLALALALPVLATEARAEQSDFRAALGGGFIASDWAPAMGHVIGTIGFGLTNGIDYQPVRAHAPGTFVWWWGIDLEFGAFGEFADMVLGIEPFFDFAFYIDDSGDDSWLALSAGIRPGVFMLGFFGAIYIEALATLTLRVLFESMHLFFEIAVGPAVRPGDGELVLWFAPRIGIAFH